MSRTPPAAVRRRLRQEVGFGCPVTDCGSPYLTWHHFDPPWSEREHHDPAGMVALCWEHHKQADAGAFTADQLRALKAEGRQREDQVRGRFAWMRQQVLAVVGGNFYLETPIMLQVQDTPVVWWNRDPNGYLLLNVHMLTTSGEPRARIEDNDWITAGAEADIACPPSGRRLRLDYPNGDQLFVEFNTADSGVDLTSRYPALLSESRGPPPLSVPIRRSSIPEQLVFPVTTVDITMNVAGTSLRLRPEKTEIGTNRIVGSWLIGGQIGLRVD